MAVTTMSNNRSSNPPLFIDQNIVGTIRRAMELEPTSAKYRRVYLEYSDTVNDD